MSRACDTAVGKPLVGPALRTADRKGWMCSWKSTERGQGKELQTPLRVEALWLRRGAVGVVAKGPFEEVTLKRGEGMSTC